MGYLYDLNVHIRDLLSGLIFLHQKNLISFDKDDPGIQFVSPKRFMKAKRVVEKMSIERGYTEYVGTIGLRVLLLLSFVLISFFGMVMVFKAIELGFPEEYFTYFILGFIVFLCAFFLCSYFLGKILNPQYTQKGQEIKSKIVGFKKYLDIAEADRIDFFNSLSNDPHAFTYYLSYAVALGIKTPWTWQYSAIINEPSHSYSPSIHIPFPQAYFQGEKLRFINYIELIKNH